MRIKIGNGLLPLNLLVVALIAVIIFSSSNVLHIVLGLPFVLLFLGYTLVLALFPKKEGMSGVERAVLSFGLSIAVAAHRTYPQLYCVRDNARVYPLFNSFLHIYSLNHCLVQAKEING